MADRFGRTFDEDVLASAADDWVDPLQLLETARHQGVHDRQTRRSTVLGAVASLVARGLVVLGDVVDRHEPWKLSPGDALARAVRAWAPLADCYDVMPGEVFWLDATPQGEATGRAVWAREVAQGTRDAWDDERVLDERSKTETSADPYEAAALARAAAGGITSSELLGIAADQGITDPEARRYTAVGVVVSLVARGLAVLDDATPGRRRTWDGSPGEAITRATLAWTAGPYPDDATPRDVLRLTLGEPRVTLGEPRVTLGEPRVTLGEPRVTLGEPRVTVGERRVTLGEPRVTLGEPRVTVGERRVTVGTSR